MDGPDFEAKTGWWVLSGPTLIEMLTRAHNGESPDMLYTELYANAVIGGEED